MNVFKKVLCILMVLCFVGTALVGCSKKQNGGTSDDANGGNGGNGATEAPTVFVCGLFGGSFGCAVSTISAVSIVARAAVLLL